ncbi:SpoIIE-like protein phosphatase domain protein [Leptospira fainei serovar Hurstbridge str. BUT 6]|uniref:SpoIIE-like protein phosphatase domain protein n=1 Tax=Leptospira fainei serovar Hurstbridge str. BUT 6 TaxID=1193011 RepID=S3VBZ4_9LEPT|nr:SpoIIE family protein phosphatase [Leptospira fainei]EPG73985.1 SpoIIE-like protein phosphatase domain protein [Leptospira fainei serovar Hurstbridge str. BUT 6]
MNHYLFLPISALIINSLLISYVFARRFRSAVIGDFLRFALFLDLWLVSYILYWSLLPAPWMTLVFKLTCFTWIPTGLLFLEVVYKFLNLASKWVLYCFRFLTLLSILVTTSTDWVIKGSILYDWGYELEPNWLFLPMSAVVVSGPAYLGLSLILIERFKTDNGTIRRQLDLLIIGSIIAFSLSVYTELLNLDKNGRFLFPPLTPVSVTIQAVFIFWAITRYGFLNISLERIAVELFRDIHDGIILVKKNGEFFFANQSALFLLQTSPSQNGFFNPHNHFANYREDLDSHPREFQLLGRTGHVFVELTKSSIRISEEESGTLYLLRDVTERKISQEKIHQLYSHIVSDLEIARVTQSSIITQKFPDKESYRIQSFFQPIEKVGGDMLRVIEHPSGRVDILFADVSGHGIASAMVGGMLSIAFQIISPKLLSPKDSLFEIHNMLSKVVLHHHISAVFASYYPDENRLDFSYAGHHPILILRSGEVILLEGEGRIILAVRELLLNDYTFRLYPEDRIVFYSDGLFEVKNSVGDILGYETFLDWLKEMATRDTASLLEASQSKAIDFGQGKYNDDLAMLVIEVGGQ